MSNQWQPRPGTPAGQELKTLVIGLIVIGIIVRLLFPNIFSNLTSAFTTTNASETSVSDVSQPSTTDTSEGNLPILPIQSTVSNSDTLSSGYWELFVSNGALQQLSVSSQDYSFMQSLIQKDNGTKTTTVFLVANGQIHQYAVSNETYSIISSLATINGRVTNSSSTPNTTPTAPVTPPSASTTTSNETLTVSNPTTSGFAIALSPALNGLLTSNFALVDSSGNPVAIGNVATSNSGATYTISAQLNAGQTYTLTTSAAGYNFGSAQSVLVPAINQ